MTSNTILDEEKVSQLHSGERLILAEQGKMLWKHMEALNAAPELIPIKQLEVSQQILSELQKLNGLLCGAHNLTMQPSADGKSMLVVPATQLTTAQLVQHIDPNFSVKKVDSMMVAIYDHRFPFSDEMCWQFTNDEWMPSAKPTYGQLKDAIDYLNNQRTQQK